MYNGRLNPGVERIAHGMHGYFISESVFMVSNIGRLFMGMGITVYFWPESSGPNIVQGRTGKSITTVSMFIRTILDKTTQMLITGYVKGKTFSNGRYGLIPFICRPTVGIHIYGRDIPKYVFSLFRYR